MTWRPVICWEGYYEITDGGQVQSVPRAVVRRDGSVQNWPSRTLKPRLNSEGYMVVRLSDAAHGRRKMARVHRLVAEAFIPNPEMLAEVNHKDGDRSNPDVRNLEWVTSAQNSQHGYDRGTVKPPVFRREANLRAKLTQAIVDEARRLNASGVAVKALARQHGVDPATMRAAIRGRTWLPDPPRAAISAMGDRR